MSERPSPDAFPSRTHDKLRYNDTDRQGHVNNAVFSTFLESSSSPAARWTSWVRYAGRARSKSARA